MDRVLIISDEVSFTSHVEKTLKDVGLDVRILESESGLSEELYQFSPDVLIIKGDGVKLSSLRVGQVLRDRFKFSGKVIIILNKAQKINPDDLNRVKMDALLFEPVGAIKVVSHVLNLITEQKESIRGKLLKLVENDASFRLNEEKILVSSGKSIDQELIHVTGQVKMASRVAVRSSEALSDEEMHKIRDAIMQEIETQESALKAKIDVYNSSIRNIDSSLKNGLSKRQTKSAQNSLRKELLVDPSQDKLDNLDEERKKFALALVKKNK